MSKEIPTKKEYKDALKTVRAYEKEENRFYKLRVEKFRTDLIKYFENNLLGEYFKIEEFDLAGTDIIPTKPYFEESYGGENDEDIEKICKKHKVNFQIAMWCYHK